MLIKNPFWYSKHTHFFLPSPVVFVQPKAACSSLVVLSLGWMKGLQHYRLIALLGWPLLPRGNSTSPRFRGLEVLSLQDSPRSSTHEGVPRWRHRKFYDLRATSYRCTYKSKKFFFWFTSDAFWKRPISSYQDSYVNFYEEIYERRWYRKRTTYPVSGGVMQEYLKRLYKQTALWLIIRSRSLRIPEEQDERKKRDVEQSAPTHARHTRCASRQMGNTADRSTMFLGTDFEKRVIWQGSVEEPAAKDFLARKVHTIEWNEV